MKKTIRKFTAIMLLLYAPMMVACNGGSETSGTSETDRETITITASAEKVYIGETLQLTASVSDAIWESGDETLATVSDSGLVTGVAAGEVTIKAKKAGYKAGTITLKVVDKDAEAGIVKQGTLEYESGTHYSATGTWGNQWTGYKDTPACSDYATASNGQYVGYMAQGNVETIDFTITTAGTANFGFVMASCLASSDYSSMVEQPLADSLTITLDGTALDLTGLVLPASSSINYYNFAEVTLKGVELSAGDHTLVTTITGTQGPNMDCINLYSATALGITQSVVEEPTYTSIGTYTYYIKGYEWGPGVYKVMLDLGDGNTVKAADLTTDLFSVTATGADGGSREVSAIYLCDADGNADTTLTEGTKIALELTLNVTWTYVEAWNFGYNSYNGCDPFHYDSTTGLNSWATDYGYEVKLAKGKTLTVGSHEYKDLDLFEVNTASSTVKVIEATESWSEAKSYTYTKSDNTTQTLTYKSYSNTSLTGDSVKDPLIIWLHGAGEGGTDPDIAILGNDVTNLGEDTIQGYFKEDGGAQGAYVLAVQTPTMWMDDGTGANGDGSTHSIYTDALKATIDQYISDNGDIDTNRIYIGGCSNGGYMTMEMITTYPSFFAAAYPICEAFGDTLFTTDLATSIKSLPIWFTASADDTTVDPTKFTIPAYQKLITAGNTDCHLSYFEHVYGNDTGKEVQYMGHWSWIYTLSDRCSKDQKDSTNVSAPSTEDVTVDGKTVTLWGWLASQEKAA